MRSVLLISLLLVSVQLIGQAPFSQRKAIAPVLIYPEANTLADIDGDGDADLIASSYVDEVIVWFENDGSGNFAEHHFVTIAAEGVRYTNAADLDGDGDIDILAGLENTEDLTWYANDGAGNFSSGIVLDSQSGNPYAIHCADLDGDGDIDVAATSRFEDYVAWYENDGLGNFSAANMLNADATGASSVCSSDVDGDGDLDVLSSASDDDTVSWYENLGGGTFSEEHIISSNFDGARGLQSEDMDGDGDMDVVCAARNDEVVAWFQNDGSGNFSQAILISSFADDVRKVECADLDNDGDMDVFTTYPADGELVWFENDGSGGFDNEHLVPADMPQSSSILSGDIDADGDEDLIMTSSINATIAMFTNDGGGVFSPQLDISANVRTPKSACTADFDGDGDQDVLSLSYHGDLVVWFENDGMGGFAVGKTVSNAIDGGNAVYAEDLDGDGDMDALSASGLDDTIAWYANDGFGNFSEQMVISSSVDKPLDVHSIDLDGDGDMDVLSASEYDDMIAWFENDGNGNFSAFQAITTTADGAQSLYCADLDGDEDLDVISASVYDNKVAWYQNDGSGTFSDAQVISNSAEETNSVYSADLDLDGDMDVISASYLSGDIAWYTNDGAGNFTSEQVIPSTATGPRAVMSHDMDGDGDMDVIAAFQDSDQIIWFPNNGDASFGAGQVLDDALDLTSSLFADDLDGDGDMDVIATGWGNSLLVWYENEFGEGCTNPDACNYSDTAINDDGSCCLGECACTDPEAANFSATATCDDGSCNYTIHGTVFHDENVNGIWDSESEASLSGIDVLLEGDETVYTTDENGQFSIPPTGGTTHTVYTVNPTELSTATNTNPREVDPADFNPPVHFGLADCGCMDPEAENYDPETLCDGGSCTYQVEGYVFDDLNENGIWEEGELPLSYTQVLVEPLGAVLYTDNEGYFSIVLEGVPHTISTINHPVFQYKTTLNPLTVDPSTLDEPILFGLGKDQPTYQITVDFYPGAGGLCDAPRQYYICYRNMGNVPLDGIVEIEYDPMYSGYEEVTPIDSVDGNILYMSFQDLQPGEMFCSHVNLILPSTDFIGEELTSVARVYGFYESEEVAYGEQEWVEIVACAYDPNDKQAFPLGYTDDHLLREDMTQEFVVRFQNTGNAPAQNITIRDTLDINFDLASFEFIANTHSVQTSLNPETRELVFFFPEIMLPDSNCCEPESHGLVSYTIRPMEGTDHGTVLENTAYIFFDNNDPIVTNTTWTTIHKCKEALALTYTASEECLGDELILASDYDTGIEWNHDYQWFDDSEMLGTEESQLIYAHGPLDQAIYFQAANPLCTETGSLELDYIPVNLDLMCPGDFDCNGVVGSPDMLILLGAFGCEGLLCRYDITQDNASNVADLLELLANFGQSCW